MRDGAAEPMTSRFPTEQQRAEFIEWLTEQGRWYVVDALGERPVGEWTWVAERMTGESADA